MIKCSHWEGAVLLRVSVISVGHHTNDMAKVMIRAVTAHNTGATALYWCCANINYALLIKYYIPKLFQLQQLLTNLEMVRQCTSEQKSDIVCKKTAVFPWIYQTDQGHHKDTTFCPLLKTASIHSNIFSLDWLLIYPLCNFLLTWSILCRHAVSGLWSWPRCHPQIRAVHCKELMAFRQRLTRVHTCAGIIRQSVFSVTSLTLKLC